MKIVSIHLAYNEGNLIYKNLLHLYDFIDEMLVWEGTLSPFSDQPIHSTDNTIEEIQRFIKEKDTKNKIKLFTTDKILANKREECEAIAKNIMLAGSNIENGDLLTMIDVDEFYLPEGFYNITEMFRNYNDMESLWVEEYQHAYRIGLCFDAEHQGRFMRYKIGAKYTASQHFFYPNDKRDISKIGQLWPRRLTGFHHLCWVKHPTLIREKVLTFKRQSFTYWYNNCYLAWPFDPETAYHNNRNISVANGWSGLGYAEGQDGRLYEFKGELPKALEGYSPDWTGYIKEHYNELRI